MHDYTAVPAVVDLACMRDAMNNLGSDSDKINPLSGSCGSHSVQVNVARSENAVQANMDLELRGIRRDFLFLNGDALLSITCLLFLLVLVNLEYLGRVVFNTIGILYPDSVVGTDSHTTMIDGLGVAGWGVGGIEAEAAMLGLPMSMLLPDVVGLGNGMNELSLADMATIANMSPEYGATMGFFPVDYVTLQYLKLTGRSDETGFAVPKEAQNKVAKFLFH
ncbi:hypothetical protein Ddye_017281 [Dipteronia dyeriana]|uniref:Aconitase/3-isopropylmalate dehydratase large subunit alpha/beta/alpha domain-containing protein n=1 Tax=Dipteronia dyeriana TaxID=168575 RepID=A0AAD9U8F2_9ROSI|nr:hypothetical protein Ddye_017281 [Dipteronia dyeriana]